MTLALVSASHAVVADELAGEPSTAICDASAPMHSCRARPQLDGDSLLLVSDAPSCSVVRWELDGVAQTTIIVDEGARIGVIDPPVTRRGLRRRVDVESCTRVADSRVVERGDQDSLTRAEARARIALQNEEGRRQREAVRDARLPSSDSSPARGEYGYGED